MTLVAGKRFVAAVAIQSDRDIFSCLASNVVSWDRRRISVRLAIVTDQCRQYFQRVGFYYKFVVFGSYMLGYSLCILQFAEILLFEPDRKCFYRFIALLGHECHNR